MSKGLAGLISVLGAVGAGMGGYAKGRAQYQDAERRKVLDSREDAEYDYQQGQRQKAQALDDNINDAVRDRAVETVAPSDMSSADVSLAGEQPTQYKVGDKVFADEGAARAALQGVNSRASKYQRAATAAASGGAAGLEKAQLYEAFAKRALDEGTDKILTGVQATAPTIDTVKKAGGTVAGAIGGDLADVFNSTGSHWKVSPDTVVQHFVDKDAAGREFVNSRIMDKSGKTVVDNVANAGLMLQDYKTRLEAKRNDTSAYQQGQQIAQGDKRLVEENRSNMAREGEQRRSNDQQFKASMAGVGIQQQRLNMERQQYQDKTIDGQMAQITKALGPLSKDEEKGYRKKLLGLGTAKGNDEALAGDLTKKWSENNPQASAGQVAKFHSDVMTSLAQAGTNQRAESEVKAAFVKNPFGSAGYGQVYNDAKNQLGMTDQQLGAMGYKAPETASAGGGMRAASAGVSRRNVIPEPPAQMAWVGNNRVTTPEYAAWDQQYGEQYRAAQAARNSRSAAALSRPHD